MSAVIGGVAGVLVLSALGMTAPGAAGGGVHAGAGILNVRLLPAGADMIHVVYPDDFIVPDGKVFVLTAVNTYLTHQFNGFVNSARVRFDGSIVFTATLPDEQFVEFPKGLAARAGVRVSIDVSNLPGTPPNGATLLGYLEDA